MTVEQIDNLQEIYARLRRSILDLDDVDAQSKKLLSEAQDCVMDAAMVAIERSFNNGDLAIAEL